MPLPLFLYSYGNFQPDLISDESDEFTVRGLSLAIAYGVSEIPLDHIQITPVPSNLDSVADCTLNSTGGGAETPGHLGVQLLGDCFDKGLVVNDQEDRFTQIIVALDMGRDTDLVDDGGDVLREVELAGFLRRGGLIAQETDAVLLEGFYTIAARAVFEGALRADFRSLRGTGAQGQLDQDFQVYVFH